MAARLNYPMEALLRLYILLWIDICNPSTTLEEDRASFSNWADANIEAIKRGTDDLQDWHEKMSAVSILQSLRQFAKNFGHESEEIFVFMSDRLSADVRSHESLSLIFQGIEQQFEK